MHLCTLSLTTKEILEWLYLTFPPLRHTSLAKVLVLTESDPVFNLTCSSFQCWNI